MPANVTPIFPLAPKIGVANISAAVTGRTVTGVTGLTSILVAGANGTRVDSVEVQATANTTAGMVRLWIYSGSGNAQLFDEVLVSAITVSGTVAAFTLTRFYNALFLPIGYSILASTNNAEAFNVIGYGGDY